MNAPVTINSAGVLADAAEAARRTLIHRGRSYAELHGEDLLDLLSAEADMALRPEGQALLQDLGRIEQWTNFTRGRIERLGHALDEIQASPHARAGARRRAQAHRALIARLGGLDDRAREAWARAVVNIRLAPLLDPPVGRSRPLVTGKGEAK